MKFICPETGRKLDSNEVSPRKLARTMWGVSPERIEYIKGETAKERYKILMEIQEKVDMENEQIEPKMADFRKEIETGGDN